MNKFIIWKEDSNMNMKNVYCPECKKGIFEILNGNGLPWSLNVKCLGCNKRFEVKSKSPNEWIKFFETD